MAESDTLSSRDDLTEIARDSDLPSGFHQSRTTPSSWKLDVRRLAGFTLTPPSKRGTPSHVWDHGEPITKEIDGEKFWLCRPCWDSRVSVTKMYPSEATSGPKRHLKDRHHIDEKGAIPLGKRGIKRGSVVEQLQRRKRYETQPYNSEEWKARYLQWHICDDISLRQSTSDNFYNLITYGNDKVEQLLPHSHNTTREYVLEAYTKQKEVIKQRLAFARSCISLSLDLWTSDSHLPLLGIVAHFVDASYTIRNVLLALPYIDGAHTGQNLAPYVLKVIEDFGIEQKLGWFMMDNAYNNDTLLKELSKSLPTIDVKQHRLRCLAHVLNLCCKAVLLGTNSDSFEMDLKDKDTINVDDRISTFEAAVTSKQDLEKRLKEWRKKGPIGKAHNLVIHVNSSDQRRQLFGRLQQQSDESIDKIFTLIADGGVRWNSFHDMVSRLIDLRSTVELYIATQAAEDPSIKDDELSPEEWSELGQLRDLLQPFKEQTMLVQGNSSTGSYGALWEWLSTADYLLTKLEAQKTEHLIKPTTHFKTSVNLGWKKLDQYYNLSDETAVYRAAIVLHPDKKLQWFKKHWSDRPKWLAAIKDIMRALYLKYRQQQQQPKQQLSQQSRELSDFERYNQLDDLEGQQHDELDRYLNSPREADGINPLVWWQAHQTAYPVLSTLAFDLLAIPCTSAECERSFSKAGHVLDEDRPRTQADLAEGTQCLRAWISAGLVRLCKVSSD